MRQATDEEGVRRVSQVRELMTSDLVTVDSSASIVNAARRMIQEKKGPLPVMEEGQLHAMITDRDIVAHVVAEGRDPNSVTVDDVATRDLVTIGPDQGVEEARQLMAQHELDRVLVVEDDMPIGIISEADIRSDEGPLAPVARGVATTPRHLAAPGSANQE